MSLLIRSPREGDSNTLRLASGASGLLYSANSHAATFEADLAALDRPPIESPSWTSHEAGSATNG